MVPLMKNKSGDEICVVCERNFRKDSKTPIPKLIIGEKFVAEEPKIEKKEEIQEPTKVKISMAPAPIQKPVEEPVQVS